MFREGNFAVVIRNEVVNSMNDVPTLERLWPSHPIILGLKWLRTCGVEIDKMIEDEKARIRRQGG